MKRLFLVVALLGAVSLAARADILANFASVDGATMNFDGAGNFSFDNNDIWDFLIGSETGGSALLNLNGNLDGSFAIGAITSTGPLQTAPVTGSGSLSIFDGSDTFSAVVEWVDIHTIGTSGGLNGLGTLNLSGITYSGSNVDLLQLAAGNDIAVITFQFIPGRNLDYLTTTATSTSYSGSVQSSVIPEPASIVGLGTVLLLLGSRLRRKKA